MGVHVGGVGGPGTHDARSQIMYSRIFSCDVIGHGAALEHAAPVVSFVRHSAGNVSPLVFVWLATWKSLKMLWPHWVVAPTGVLNVKWATMDLLSLGIPPPVE